MYLHVLASHATDMTPEMLLAAGAVQAHNKYDPGVTDTEILIGQTNPYSGPLTSYSTQGRVQAAFYNMINEQGGVNGRKIKLISLDDGYQPPKTVEQTRKLVEDDQVVAIVGSMGTPTNTAIVKYMNAKKVPHILLASGASKWGNPKDNPWTMGWYPTYFTEGAIYGKYILKNIKDARIGVLYQNDDYGKDFDKSVGIISTAYLKDPADPQFANDDGIKWYREFMKKYYPEGDLNDPQNQIGISIAQTAIQILKQCGNELTRENIVKQAANLKSLELPLLLPGI